VEEIAGRNEQACVNTDDVATAAGADALVRTAVERFGRLDALINNAGILRDGVIVNLSEDDWDRVVSVNLRGQFLPLQAAARYWRERSKAGESVDAAIVNTSSESGVFGNAGQANYAAAKAAVASLAEVASKELSRYGVRTNTILPRARTRLTEAMVPPPRTDRFDKWDPANVSPFVGYLVRPGCKINGQVFLVGGGLVQRVAPWSLDPDWKLTSEGRWNPEELAEAVDLAGLPDNTGRITGNVR